MQPVNGYFLYTLGSLSQLFALTDGPAVSIYEPVFLRSVVLLDAFKSNDLNKHHLPDSVRHAEGLWSMLGGLMEAARQNPASPMHIQIRMQIAHAVNAFQTVLEQELGHAHTFILEEKRGYTPEVLIRDIAKILPPKVLPYLSKFTLVNLQDAGAALVFDHFTSSGFLTMRAVEDTSRAYYELVTGEPAVTIEANRDRRYVTLGGISHRLGRKLERLRSTGAQTGRLGLVVPTVAALCEVYRNPLSHPEIVKLDEDSSIDVFNKGIDAICTMVRDVADSGSHFEIRPEALTFQWT